LEKIAFGRMNMSVNEFYDMLPRHFFNKMEGFYEMENLRQRNDWERTRWSTCILLNVHVAKGKRYKPKDLIEFEWDKKVNKDSKTDYEILKSKAEYHKKLIEHKNKK
tara:strand:+ start:1313 stop:1633 length:321 start_codon:yes stop_codon:yes gene_type:complete